MNKLTCKIHHYLRSNRARIAIDYMKPQAHMTLLDMGGSIGLKGEWDFLRSLFREVTIVNTDFKMIRNIAPNVHIEIGDACNLPYPDNSFDWVFSNAVLEHVGDVQRQQAFCREMQRVARVGYFLSTPNKAFLIDPHTYLPGYHWMPGWIQKWYIKLSLGHMQTWQETMRLVNKRELEKFFPDADIKSVGPFGLNLIVEATR